MAGYNVIEIDLDSGNVTLKIHKSLLNNIAHLCRRAPQTTSNVFRAVRSLGFALDEVNDVLYKNEGVTTRFKGVITNESKRDSEEDTVGGDSS